MKQVALIQASKNADSTQPVQDSFNKKLQAFFEEHQNHNPQVESDLTHAHAGKWNSFSVLVSWETPSTRRSCPRCEINEVSDEDDYLCDDCR